ncbi:hypothetical protein [Methylocella sp.]|uniref:hypothetical protein n=1 Tax=Methylocella sp. TaxID=1978226 RepID=UPI0035B40637
MTNKGKKLEPPLKLDMDFGEALERFTGVDPREVAESVERSKQKKPPENEPPRRPERKQSVSASPTGRQRKPDGD